MFELKRNLHGNVTAQVLYTSLEKVNERACTGTLRRSSLVEWIVSQAVLAREHMMVRALHLVLLLNKYYRTGGMRCS